MISFFYDIIKNIPFRIGTIKSLLAHRHMQTAGLGKVGAGCGKRIGAAYWRRRGADVEIGKRTTVKHAV